ncbi:MULTISPECIES: hypothetical protein [unclassified Devosia]|nr:MULTISPECIES: hypothetical protein [unclassified Devosia]
MTKQENFFRRALNAIVDARTQQAERYVAQFDAKTKAAQKHNTDI